MDLEESQLGSFARQVTAILNDVVRPYGFASGQGGSDGARDDESQVVFCAAYDDVVQRALAVAAPPDYAVGAELCFDIVVTGSVAAGVTAVEIEGVPLAYAVSATDEPKDLELATGRLAEDLQTVRNELVALLAAPPLAGPG
jgi:hypothetical protein